ncbi:50S ribosomal protein L11 [candidate division TM6 bacterium RIFCSPHIGHO2_12_FULL_32_22]|nr:MAG: 50S ribosomal protein L11 [candidate division TM6 bacterium RIFCSPHIGHO2_12_FULL_32_22]
MAKKIKSQIKLQIMGGTATPAPPVGSSLGQHGVNIKQFCDKFNALTANRRGETVPVFINVYEDRSFDFITKSTPASEMIRKKSGISKGASKAGEEKVGRISWADIEEIAKAKMADLNAFDLEKAKKVVAGTARSMGVEVV